MLIPVHAFLFSTPQHAHARVIVFLTFARSLRSHCSVGWHCACEKRDFLLRTIENGQGAQVWKEFTLLAGSLDGPSDVSPHWICWREKDPICNDPHTPLPPQCADNLSLTGSTENYLYSLITGVGWISARGRTLQAKSTTGFADWFIQTKA